jgi:hypothetical protein
LNAASLARPALFVGGPSRSGTMMLSSILSRHPLVQLQDETHFFDDLRARVGAKPLSAMTPAQRDAVLDTFRALAHRHYGRGGRAEESWLTREALAAEASRHGDDADSVFMAFCLIQAARRGKEPAVWGEKTPRNVFRIDDILAAFPAAKVICMVRDPRACVTSYRDWAKASFASDAAADAREVAALAGERRRQALSYDIVLATLLWRAAVNAAHAAAGRHGPERVRIQRYEDATADPAGVFSDICRWIGVEFEPSMLSVTFGNSSYGPNRKGAGVSSKPVDRWREKLSAREIRVIQTVAGKTMRRSGYAPLAVDAGPLAVLGACAAAPFAVVRAVGANSDRIADLPSYLWRRVRAAIR